MGEVRVGIRITRKQMVIDSKAAHAHIVPVTMHGSGIHRYVQRQAFTPQMGTGHFCNCKLGEDGVTKENKKLVGNMSIQGIK